MNMLYTYRVLHIHFNRHPCLNQFVSISPALCIVLNLVEKVLCFCVSGGVCGRHGGGPHYLVGSHTDMATARRGQLADLFLFPQLFNELVMGRTAQLPRQLAWTPTLKVAKLYILGSQSYANVPPLPVPFLFLCQSVLLVPSWTSNVR